MVKPYSMDLRKRIVNAVEEGGSIRKVAQRFVVAKPRANESSSYG